MIRLQNLKLLMRQKKWKTADLAAALKVSDSYASRIVNGKDPFTEKTARKIETAAQYPHKWLDGTHMLSYRAIDTNDSDTDTGQTDEAKSTEVPYAATETAPTPHAGEPPVGGYQQGTVSDDTNLPMAPVIAWARLGNDLFRANDEWPASAMRVIPTTQQITDTVKWVVVEDGAPVAGIRPGDMVLVDPVAPYKKLKRNQVALFRYASGEYLLRRFNPLPGDDENFEAMDDEGRVLDKERHGLILVAACIGKYTERLD